MRNARTRRSSRPRHAARDAWLPTSGPNGPNSVTQAPNVGPGCNLFFGGGHGRSPSHATMASVCGCDDGSKEPPVHIPSQTRQLTKRPPQQNSWVSLGPRATLVRDPVTENMGRCSMRPAAKAPTIPGVSLGAGLRHCRVRGKKPQEGVWGNLRSRFPQNQPTNSPGEPQKDRRRSRAHAIMMHCSGSASAPQDVTGLR